MQTEEELRNVDAFRVIINRIINDGETELCEQYLDPEMTIRRFGLDSLSRILPPSRAARSDDGPITGFKLGLTQIRTAFPDWNHKIETVIAKDDWVSGTWTLTCTHQGTFMGLPATRRHITMSEAGFMRFVDGRMIDGWFIGDELALAQQLGIRCSPPTQIG
ncbi:ester cyclase (plasmid) [Paraburkholderia strydomiana]